MVKEIEAKGVRGAAFKADQAKTKEVEALVQSVVKRFGRLDILVNNAGVFATGQVHERANNQAELDQLFAVNVGGVATAVRGGSADGDGGRIISIGSVVGEQSPFPGIADYSATKGAARLYPRLGARSRPERHHGQ